MPYLSEEELLRATIIALLAVSMVFLRWHNKQRVIGVDLQFTLVVATLRLVANIPWVDLFVIVLLPYAVLYKYLSEDGMRYYVLVAAIASALFVSSPRVLDVLTNLVGRYERLPRNPFAMGLSLYGLTLLWVAVAVALRQVSNQEIAHGPKS